MSRPFVLDPLFRSLTVLPGIGQRNAPLLERLIGGPKVLDLLWHAPIDFVDRRFSPHIQDAPEGKVATIKIRVGKHFPNARKGLPYKVWCHDDTGVLNLVFFHARKDWLEKQLPEGEERLVSGKIEHYQGKPQMVHPDYIVKPEDRAEIEILEPIYPLTAGITNKVLHKAIKGALKIVPPLPDWLDAAHKKRENWLAWHDCIKVLHFDSSVDHERAGVLQRLAYDELLANQLALALVRHKQKKKMGRVFKKSEMLQPKILSSLPFSLTSAQKKAIKDIDEDMNSSSCMLRLLQGDVGSGKTIVACMAMMNALESGAQVALMAPTEILARQHAETLKPLMENAGLRMVTLTGRDKGKARDVLTNQIRNGAAQVVIGTHALFQDSIEFKDLGLVVIDEQHRFGVDQRLKLSQKSNDDRPGVDVLVMTATPIPRTLSLTAYGDMDVSILDEKPPGRKPVDTRLFPKDKIDSVVSALKRQVKTGARVYWVCPLVEESDVLNVSAAEERYDILKSIFGDRVGLLHGRMKPDEKDAVMARFMAGDLDILVSTTVIEVGVNVPEATIMIIEHAERFGLAQLHQLRGRVGRGADKSYCFLIYDGPLSDVGKERLSIMRETEDGFLIAEKDLELRGTGDILGTRQSGMPTFKVADLTRDRTLLMTASDDAKMIVHQDPNLQTPRGEALRTLLYLFEQDQAIKYLRSG